MMISLRKIRGWLIALVILAALAGGILALSKRADTKAQEAAAVKPVGEKGPVMVTAEPVAVRPIQRRVQVVGSLYGLDEVAITPKVEGRIVKIHKYVGDKVFPGQLLMEIEEKNYQLAVNEAKNALKVELAKLGLTDELPDNLDRTKLPSVAKAAAQEKLAIAQRDRLKKLSSATAEERDKADAELSSSQAGYKQTLLEAETVLAQVRHKQAVLATAQQRLDDTKVVVPAGSVVTEKTTSNRNAKVVYVVSQRNVSEGETVGVAVTSTPVYRLVIADPLKLQATVPERHINEIKIGQAVEVNVESSMETFLGEVARINPTVDRSSRTFQVEILIRNTQAHLHAGSFAKAAILTHIDDKALSVPEEALATFAGVTKLFVLRGETAVEIPVEAGVRVEVSGGGRSRFWIEARGKNLRANDVVVTSGQSQLSDGALARIRPTSVK